MTTLNEYRNMLAKGMHQSFTSLYMDDDKLTKLLDSLGLSIEDEKPAPGLYVDQEGRPVFVDSQTDTQVWQWLPDHALMGQAGAAFLDQLTLTPARVVSEAEHNRLTRDAGPGGKVAAWDKLRQHSVFQDLASGEGSLADRMIGRLNELTKAHSAPVEMPGREIGRAEVERAVDEACKGLFVRQVWADDLTDAIHENLLGGEQK